MIAPIYQIGKLKGFNSYGVITTYLTSKGETKVKEQKFTTELDCLDVALTALQARRTYLKRKARNKESSNGS